MPYHLEKGPMFSGLEAVFNDEDGLRGFLRRLWIEGSSALGSLGVLGSNLIDNPNADAQNAIDDPSADGKNAKPANRIRSMSVGWFGRGLDGSPQPEFGNVDPTTDRPTRTTGYWQSYYGDVKEIVARTLLRAGEVSLGIDLPTPAVGELPASTRHWPVDFFWKCGQPRFEGWITWRQHADDQHGHVNVILATPASKGDLVLENPGGPDHLGRETAMSVDAYPGLWQKWQGTWVTAHEHHQQWVIKSWMPTISAQWGVPRSLLVVKGDGNVGTWFPNYGNGGAPPEPLHFADL